MTASKPPPLAELRRRFLDAEPTAAERRALAQDGRAGAKALLAQLERRREALQEEGRRQTRLLAYETKLWRAGVRLVAGVDEAGVSPLAGPVVAAAVILAEGTRLPGVDDSKKLDEPTREALAPKIRAAALAWATGSASPEEIDRLNPYHASLLAMRRAVEALPMAPEQLLVDARRVPGFAGPQQGIIKGDAKSLSIAAASILAKTTRDALLRQLDVQYPGYGFAQHKGYPVASHVEALRRLGVTPVHRRSFAPVREALGLSPGKGDQLGLFGATGPDRR